MASGFVEEADALNAESGDVATVQARLEGLQRLQASREAQVAAPVRVRPQGGATSAFRPMWHAPSFRLEASGPKICRRDVEGVDGAFVLSDVLSGEEAARMVAVAERMGFEEGEGARVRVRVPGLG